MAGVVRYSPQNAPLSALIASKLAGANDIKWVPKKDQQDVELTAVPSGDVLQGSTTVARYIARSSPALYGTDALSATKIDMWMDKANASDLATVLNTHLQLRTFVVGYAISLADVVLFVTLIPTWAAFVETNGKTNPHVVRWFNYIESLPGVAEVLNTHAPKPKAQEKGEPSGKIKTRAGWQSAFDIPLPNATEGGVVTRFPPEPSGYMHIGHVKAAILNNYFARAYKGKLILRFDDTNPAKEKDEYADNIKDDLATLGIIPDSVSYTSDFFDQLLSYGQKVLETGKAYIDDTPQDQMQAERKALQESRRRNNTVAENLRLWDEMKKGTEEGQKCVMRAKIDPKNPNGALRDPGLYRCSPSAHYRTGTKYKVYPMYDFACPIVDSLEGVTHALRSSEYHDRNPLYYWVVDAVGLRKPHIEDFSRLNFEYVLLSKRKLQYFVEKNIVKSWDDPRFPTVQGVLRRGMTVEALREFIMAQGASKALNLMTMDKLWALNKKIIDPAVPRYTALDASKKISFKLTNGPMVAEMKTVPVHKKNPALGVKALTYLNHVFLEEEDAVAIKDNEEVTLMDWGNAIVRKINYDNGKVVSLEGELHLEGDFKKTEKKLTWLPDTHQLIPIVLQEMGYLITKKKLEETDNFVEHINHESLKEIKVVGDSNMRTLNKGDKLQLERRGYYIVDSPFVYPSKPMVLVAIPDGKEDKTAVPEPTKKEPAKKQQKQQKQTPSK